MILSLTQIVIFFLILARIIGIFLLAPIFGSKLIPAFIKVGLCIWIAIVLWFVVPIKVGLPTDIPTFIIAIINEVMLGFLIGFVCYIIFSIIQAAADIMDLQMGMSIATIVSPTTGGVVSVVGLLGFILAFSVFLAINGHHMILSSLHQSFRMLPLGAPINFGAPALAGEMIEIAKAFWLTAIRIAAPIVVLIFISDFTFGIVSRVAPQVNVFMLGFQVKPSLGFAGIMLCLPILSRQVVNLVERIGEEMLKLMVILKP